jgi:hypothetical protein
VVEKMERVKTTEQFTVTDLNTNAVKTFSDNGAALGYILALLDVGHSYSLDVKGNSVEDIPRAQ